MNIGILGSGAVAQTLGAGYASKGHSVMLGSREPAQLAAWAAGHPGTQLGQPAEAAAFGELLVLAVKGSAATAVLAGIDPGLLAGKVVIDTCNPIADAAPVDGVLSYFTGPNESLFERLQAQVPAARLVKAFNSVGAAAMIDPDLPGGPPTMFICGNDAAAKATVQGLLAEVGWETADMGSAVAARAIEPLCILWCIPGFRANRWGHAFRLLQPAG